MVRHKAFNGSAARSKRFSLATGRSKKSRSFGVAMRRGAASNRRTGGFAGIELKFLDTAWNSVTINTSTDGSGGEIQPSTGCTNAISVPAQGDGESNRDGRKYTLKSAWFSGIVLTSPSANQADATDIPGYYFAMVLDTQANGATVVSEDVFINPGTTGHQMLPKPLRNLQNSRRFRILDSKYVPVGGMYAITDGTNTGSLAAMTEPTVNLSWKGNIQCTSTGTNADVASASDNAIHIISYAGDATPLVPTIRAKARVRFVG